MAERYFLTKDQPVFAFDRTIPPVLEIDPGSTVTFETGDVAYQRLYDGETKDTIGLENFNALTGPVYVRGAEPGDALRIDILEIQISRAWTAWGPGSVGLGAYATGRRVMQTPVEGDRVHIADNLSVPLEPMIGCIGVAPATGRGSTFGPAYPFGGNMDLRELSPSATLWLPVQVPGALVALGDLHAAMGQAEPTRMGLEASGIATLRIDLDKGKHLDSPRLRVGSDILCVGLGETHQEAYQHALDQAFELLTGEYGLEPFAAFAYTSARVGMRLGGPASPIVLAVVPEPLRHDVR